MEELAQQIDLAALQEVLVQVVACTPRVIGGLAILIIGWLIAGWLGRMEETFDAKGISIPFLQRDVHVHHSKASLPDLHTVA